MSFRNKSLKENLDRITNPSVLREGEQWRAEVTGIGENRWSRNDVTYPTREEAKQWLDKLSMRWTGYDMSRVVPADTPQGEQVDPNDPTIYQIFRR